MYLSFCKIYTINIGGVAGYPLYMETSRLGYDLAKVERGARPGQCRKNKCKIKGSTCRDELPKRMAHDTFVIKQFAFVVGVIVEEERGTPDTGVDIKIDGPDAAVHD